jgi:hypothetical protein
MPLDNLPKNWQAGWRIMIETRRITTGGHQNERRIRTRRSGYAAQI